MTINKNLCKHVWTFGFHYQSTGNFKPRYWIVLFCEKCTKVKAQEVKT